MDIRQATEQDVDAIVAVHLAAFNGFFLTMLGPSFLRGLYRAFLHRQHGILRVAVSSENTIVGFAAGTSATQLFFSQLRKDKWFSFLLRAIPGMLKNPVIVVKKLYYAAFYKGDRPASLSDVALLSSIAVSPDMAGKAVGKALLADYEQQVKAAELPALFLTTDKFGNDNVVAFYQRAGYQIESEFTQPDGRQMLRLIKYF